MRRRLCWGLAKSALFCLALVSGGWARAADASPATRCPTALELSARDLYGIWQLTLWPEGGSESWPSSTGAVLFGPHPEYPGSVRGRLRRSSPGADLEAEVAGDVGDDGEFGMDESADGKTMDAVWTGTPGDCGREIRGVRQPAEGRVAAERPLQFLLRRSPDRR